MPNKFKLKTKQFFAKNSAFFLTCIGSVGMVSTVILAVRATPKAYELIKDDIKRNHDGDSNRYTKQEAIKSCYRCYIPSIIIGTTSLCCVLGAGILSRCQQKSLISAYVLIGNVYQEYRSKVKELYGDETDRKIKESIVKEKCKDVHIWDQSSGELLDFGDEKNETMHLFYDTLSERYFETSISRVLQAENHLNRNFMFGGYARLNDFYKFLGLKQTDYGKNVGWSMFNGDIYWIDFYHQKTVFDDGLECYIIEPFFTPTSDFLEYL